ncbi:MAG: response regulator [Bacteriovoracaceae bacterium]|nr:response regulator [Bacteriovoracaceae bacterium]
METIGNNEKKSESQPDSTTEKPLIFLIDDDEDLLAILEKALSDNFQTLIITEPIEAVQLAEEKSPRAMILDLQMPNIDGYEALKIFREHPFTNNIPVICMSSDSNQKIRTHLDTLGANGFIKKPLNVEILSRTVNSILRSLNQKVKSKKGDYNCYVTFNDFEKNNLMYEKISSLLENGERVVFLSWIQGKDFIDSRLMPFVDDNRLIFLEIKSSMIMKFPFMQNISPVMADIHNFTHGESLQNYYLIFDEPRNLYDLSIQEKALSKTMELSRLINTSFKGSHIYMTKTRNPNTKLFQLKIARVFSGMSVN